MVGIIREDTAAAGLFFEALLLDLLDFPVFRKLRELPTRNAGDLKTPRTSTSVSKHANGTTTCGGTEALPDPFGVGTLASLSKVAHDFLVP